MQISDALAAYLVQLEADGRSPHTLAQARRHVGLLVRQLGDPEIASVRHEDVAAFLASPVVAQTADGRPRRPTSANALRSSLRAFFGFVHAAGYAPTNAARLVRRARVPVPRPRAVPEPEVERLLAALDRATTPAELRDRALVHLLLRAGLRVGSAVGLDVGYLDLADVAYLPAGTAASAAAGERVRPAPDTRSPQRRAEPRVPSRASSAWMSHPPRTGR